MRGSGGFATNGRDERVLHAIEASAAQYSCDDGSRGACVADAHVTAAGVAIDRHLRNQRHPDARRDHAEQAAELAAFERDFGSDTCARAGIDAEVAKTVTVAQHHERLA